MGTFRAQRVSLHVGQCQRRSFYFLISDREQLYPSLGVRQQLVWGWIPLISLELRNYDRRNLDSQLCGWRVTLGCDGNYSSNYSSRDAAIRLMSPDTPG